MEEQEKNIFNQLEFLLEKLQYSDEEFSKYFGVGEYNMDKVKIGFVIGFLKCMMRDRHLNKKKNKFRR